MFEKEQRKPPPAPAEPFSVSESAHESEELRATREEERGDIGVAGRGRGDERLAEVELEVVVLEQVLDADRVAVGARGEKLGGELQAAVRRA